MRPPDPRSPAWRNGERTFTGKLAIGIDDPAFQSGLGLFETLCVDDGAVYDLERHVARLARGAAELDLPLPAPGPLIAAILDIGAHHAPHAWIKVHLTGGGQWTVFGGGTEAAPETPPTIAAELLPWIRPSRGALSGLKSLNYADSARGLAWARARGFDDGLWLNERGHLVESTIANLFVIRRDKLYTPTERDGLLPGTVRDVILERNELTLHAGKLRVPRLLQADEAFLTSSVAGLRAIVRVGKRTIGAGGVGPHTAELHRKLVGWRSRTVVRPACND